MNKEDKELINEDGTVYLDDSFKIPRWADLPHNDFYNSNIRYIDCGYRICNGLTVRSGTRYEKFINGKWILIDIIAPDERVIICNAEVSCRQNKKNK